MLDPNSEEAMNEQLGLGAPPPQPGGLQVQTAMPPPQASPPPAPGQNEALPVVPSGQLGEWIKQHQAQEEESVPSGAPSKDDQQRAMISRLIGNMTGGSIAGMQNMIGILKPGAADYSQAEAQRKQGEGFAQQALGRAPAARNEAIQNSQLGAMQDEKRQKHLQMVQALKQQQDASDPNSDTTKQAKAAMVEKLQNYAAVTQNPELKDRFNAMLSLVAAPGITAARIDAMDKSGDLVKLLGQESNERAAGNANQVKGEIAQGTNRLGYAQLNEKIAHDSATEGKEAHKELQVKINQDRIANDQIKDLDNADTKLTKLIDGISSGKVDVSLVHGVMQKGVNLARKVSPSASDALGLHIDTALQEMKGMAPLVQGLAERSVTKSSRYTPQRWMELTNLPEDSDEMIKTKFSTMRDFIHGLKQETEGLLHTDDAGNPAEQIAENKASQTGRVQQQANAREKQRTVMDDPQKPAALKWAKDHSSDPRAQTILQHYGVGSIPEYGR